MRRWFLTIPAFLLLGAVVNVAVAWGCALWVPYSKPPQLQVVGLGSDRARFDVFRAFGSEFVQGPSGNWSGLFSRNRRVNLEWPRRGDWSRGRTLGPRGRSQRFEWVSAEEARGWPALSLSWHYWVEPTFDEYAGAYSATRSLRYGWPCGGTRVVQHGMGWGPVSLELDARIIPYRPIWRGFAINTLFYATLLWLLIPGPFALRRFLRLKRGLCPKCAYPMGESSVCTECGYGLPERARTT